MSLISILINRWKTFSCFLEGLLAFWCYNIIMIFTVTSQSPHFARRAWRVIVLTQRTVSCHSHIVLVFTTWQLSGKAEQQSHPKLHLTLKSTRFGLEQLWSADDCTLSVRMWIKIHNQLHLATSQTRKDSRRKKWISNCVTSRCHNKFIYDLATNL